MKRSEITKSILEVVFERFPSIFRKTRTSIRAIARSRKLTFSQKMKRIEQALKEDPNYFANLEPKV